MRSLLTLLLCLASFAGSAQITAPDTVCINTPVNMSTTYEASEYNWVYSPLNIDQTMASPFTNTPVSGLNTPTFGVMKNDGGNWYAFITNYSTNEVVRVSFGTSPLSSTFTTTNLGTVGSGGLLEGIDVIKDQATGNWYGFVVNANTMSRMDFGTSLANTPTVTNYTVSGMTWAHQIGVQKYGSNWVAFIADRNSTVYRADLGTSPNGTPTFTALPYVGGIQNPCNFAVYKQGSTYYMLVCNLINNTLTLMNFGSSIQNNTPTGTALGNPGSRLSLPRSVIVSADCNQLLGYVMNETGNIIKLDFSGNITNTPSASVAATGTSQQNGMCPYSYNGKQYLLIVDYGTPGFYTSYIITYPAGSDTHYYTKTNTHTFTTAGLHDISLLCDEEGIMGQAPFCKQIYVKNNGFIANLPDTNVCVGGPAITLDASGSGSSTYLWNTGSTSSSISVNTPGTYWVQTTGGCGSGTDTIHVAARPAPLVGLTDTLTCADSAVLLHGLPQPVGSTYEWNTGHTSPTIYGVEGLTYWLTVTNSFGCSSTDTTTVGLAPTPIVDIGDDTSICGSIYSIVVNIQLPASKYLWSTGETTPAGNLPIGPNQWLVVTNTYGCIGSDTIDVDSLPVPQAYLGPDKTVCGDTILLKAPPQPDGTRYIWSTGDTTASIVAKGGNTYWLAVGNQYNCSAVDTITLLDMPHPFIELGPRDTTICRNEILPLPLGISSGGTDYLWSTGSTNPNFNPSKPGTYWVSYYNECYIARDTITLTDKNCSLWFPVAFSPNGDGLNDIAHVLGDVAGVSDYQLAIYNRWGEKVYYTSDVYSGWDGAYKGTQQPMGVFVYYIKYKYNGQPDMMKGNITLIR